MAQNNTSKKSTKSGRKAIHSKGKRPYVKKASKVHDEKQELLRYEIIVMTFVAIGLFLILCVYFNIGGIAGKGVRNVSFGIFGVGAYLIPIFILGSAIFKIFNKKNERLNNKLMLLVLLVPAFSSFIHIIYIKESQINIYLMGKSAFFPALVNYFSVSSKLHAGGGFIGGFFGDFFAMLLGKSGSLIVILLINLSLIILLTEKSLFKLLKFIGVKIQEISSSTYSKVEDAIAERGGSSQKGKSTYAEEETTYLMNIEQQETTRKVRENMLGKSTIIEDYDIPKEDSSESLQESEEPKELEKISEVAEKKKESVQISFFKDAINKPNQEKVDMKDIESIKGEMKAPINKTLYEYPPLQLLKDNPFSGVRSSKEMLHKNAEKLEQTLESFGVQAKVINISYGPTVTRYELQPDQGVKVSKIVNLSDDIALNLAASGIRMEAPIPGKSLIGIEVPNKEVSTVHIKEVIDTIEFMKFPSKIAFALGKDISGETIIADIARMPHMLISGATGSGKSVCINTLITSILYKANPNEVKLLMIDPKVVELKVYNGIPHLLIPVVTDPKKAAGALYWAVQEMSERYQLFANANVRDLVGYNKFTEQDEELNKLPQIVIIVDELADLMQVAAKDVEDAICRLAQMARAAGIHLILATQRPSVDVITGIIKANIPSRIAFAVSSGVDSRTIIDMNGAEKLIGKGDMLYYPVGMPKPIRVQGAFISDKEVERVVAFLKASQKANYNQSIMEQISKDPKATNESESTQEGDYDTYFEEALELVIEREKASASMLQRKFRVGYNRAARIIDQLHEAGFIGPEEGSKPRKVNLTLEDYYKLKHEANENEASDEAVISDGED
ncbi:MAG: cell division protein FtsK [Firmicutes bacterium HGW-Firmicutes-1]|jgi:S-DNA-T family DNA segregation ATPase FtsK/SpoIIIE|nr:MAG: cell division protein FtsK [Firmicutes bacterium HGW-Firmicutes-1]